ncbi:MAG: cadherin domain-containing protein [Candidatus Moranbacteria bacterium]|nr:cadherin domain-containing protein [Candidatus Moranbacteria bacterium]
MRPFPFLERRIKTKKFIPILLAVFIFSAVLFFAKPVSAAVFAPSSCGDLSSTNLANEMSNQVDSRIFGLASATGKIASFTTRATSTGAWLKNASVWTNRGSSALDLTGQSPWNSTGGYTRSGTLISPRHIAFANHYPIANGATVVFIDADNNIVSRTLQNQTAIAGTDIKIGVLDSDVPANIAYYPIISIDQMNQYLLRQNQVPMILLDQDDHAIIHDLYSLSASTVSHTQPLDATRNIFNETIIGGDSGNPGFFAINGQLVLAITHYTANSGSFYGGFIAQINTAMANLGGGYQVSTYDLSCFSDYAAPALTPKTFSIEEHSATGTLVGTITATGNPTTLTKTYSILSGNTNNTFAINSSTGDITVADSTTLDYDTTPTFSLVVQAADNWSPPGVAMATVTISLWSRFNNSGQTFTLLKSIGSSNYGASPVSSPTLSADGNTLYGMTEGGGSASLGIIYSIGLDGSNFTILHSFTGGTTDGANPYGSLTLSADGNTLYGMTSNGGSANKGVIFSMATTGGAMTYLHSFTGGTTDGANPRGSLILSGSTLYGMTNIGSSGGSASNKGVIFSIATTGGTMTYLHSFTGGTTDGAIPYGSLTLSAGGNTLYGMTSAGSSGGSASNVGVIFSMATTGGTMTYLHSFTGGTTDGANPRGSLILSGSTLYGMTSSGGSSAAKDGIILLQTLDIDPPIASNFSPIGDSTITTPTPTVTFSLNENGDFRSSLTDQSYADMTTDCAGDGTQSITCPIANLGADGPKTIYFAGQDALGNKQTAGNNYSINYILDTTAPIGTGETSPLSGSTISDPAPTITFSLTENATCRSSLLDESFDDMANDVICSGNGTQTASCHMGNLGADGAKTIYFACIDNVGNKHTADNNYSVNYTLDTTAPTGGAFTINSGATYTNSTSATLNITCPSDSWTPVQMAFGDAASPVNWADCAATQAYTLASGDGAKTVYVRFKDGGDHTTADLTRTITLDTTPPSGGSVSYSDGEINQTSISITVSDGTDSGSNINTASRILQRKSAALSNGTCGSYDDFATITHGGTYPDFTDPTLSSGNCYEYQYLVSDNAANQQTYASASTVKVDNVVPSAPGIPATATPTNSTSQTWSWSAATDAVSGVASYVWRVTTDLGAAVASDVTNAASAITSLPQGIYNFFVKALDNATNQGSESQGSVAVDTTAPAISNAAPQGANYPAGTDSATLTLTTNENATCKYSTADQSYQDMPDTFQTTSNQSHSTNISNLQNGQSYIYYARCQDPAGNIGSQQFSFSVSSSDFIPTLAIGNSHSYSLSHDITLAVKSASNIFRGRIESFSGGRVEIYQDGNLFKNAKIDKDHSWRIRVNEKSRNAIHTYQFKYYDQNNNLIETSQTFTVAVDRENPKFTYFPRRINASPGDTITWQATDNDQIESYQITFHGKTTNSNVNFFIVPSNIPPGLWKLTVKAYDRAGNSQKRTVRVRVR